jgi:hypothetical protein
MFWSAEEYDQKAQERKVCPSFFVGSLLSVEDHETYAASLAAACFGLGDGGIRFLDVVKVRSTLYSGQLSARHDDHR